MPEDNKDKSSTQNPKSDPHISPKPKFVDVKKGIGIDDKPIKKPSK